MSRVILHDYRDPLDLVWLAAAERCGLRVVRSDEVYAAYDGAGTLTLSTPEAFDADDSLAQLVLHELCHGLVQGEASHALPDWGLDNRSDRDLDAEHACHRLQAALGDLYGLRRMLAPTTEHRPHYDGLPDDPLADADDPVVAAARAGYGRALSGPWAPALRDALAATAAMAHVARPFAPDDSTWSLTGEPRAHPR